MHLVYSIAKNGFLYFQSVRIPGSFRYSALAFHRKGDILRPERLIHSFQRGFRFGETDVRSALVHRFLDFLRLRPGLQGRAHMRFQILQGLPGSQHDQRDERTLLVVQCAVVCDFTIDEPVPHGGKVRIGGRK